MQVNHAPSSFCTVFTVFITALIYLPPCIAQPVVRSKADDYILLSTLQNTLRDESLRDDIEMSTSQMEDLKEFNERFSKVTEGLFAGLDVEAYNLASNNNLEKEERERLLLKAKEEMRDELNKISREVLREYENLLTPRQMERIEQIAYQKKFGLASGTGSMVMQLLKYHEIDGDLLKLSERRLKAIEDEYHKNLSELNETTRKKIAEAIPDRVKRPIEDKTGKLIILFPRF